MAPRIYLANVGANSSHPYASPLFADGTYELLPIPEQTARPGPHSVLLGGLRGRDPSAGTLRPWVPERLWGVPAHLDPEFETMTYGDNCERSPRALGLKAVQPGDWIFFLARLASWHDGGYTGAAGFFLVGCMEIEAVLPNVRRRPPPTALERFGANAHVRRGLNDPRNWDGFWVFGGSSRSRRFRRAVPVDRAVAQSVFVSARGLPWRWDSRRSDLQTIGSYTRTCRCIIDPATAGTEGRLAALKHTIEQFNPGDDGWQPRGLRS
jgi:hypothetical protein